MADPIGSAFDLSQAVVGLLRDGSSRLIPNAPGPPARVSGLTVGAPLMTRNAPHGGERHPDGDELLYLISGRVSVILEREGTEHSVVLQPGQAVIVPRGTWHRVVLQEPSRILHITPGPGGEHRPLPRQGAV
jgi:mannose-6-phosphate isomerase-like protein (cupin superfamily)